MLAPGDASPTFPFHAGWTLIAYGIPDDLPKLTQATFIGILIAVSGNILISLALNLQKLAHKRVEAQVRANRPKGTGNEHRTSGSAIQRRVSESPSLDERDEDEIHAMTSSQSNTSNARLSEVEPLNPSWREPTYGSVTHEANGHNPKDVRPRPGFTSHTMPRWFRGHNPRISAPVLPVDVVSADSELLQQTSKSNTRQDMVEEHNETEYLKSKLWWLGFFLMNVGETGNFISYAWAPASVVAPLGTFALIANCLFAPLLLGEHFRQRDLIGITIAIVGAVTVVLSTNASNTRLDPDALLKAISQMPFIIYSAIYLGLGLILATLSHNEIGRQWVFIDVEWIDMFSKWITYPVLAVRS
ncbi:hypothetical protein H0H93_008347 [Arthromyces matolae]|nr:hypothetical protein H0H93_008347 [Arthromyces matolae]